MIEMYLSLIRSYGIGEYLSVTDQSNDSARCARDSRKNARRSLCKVAATTVLPQLNPA